MKAVMLALFLCGMLLFSGCSPAETDNPNTPPKDVPVSTPSKVSSKKTCCGKDICTCQGCECCGACENFSGKTEKIDMSKVE